MQKEQTELTLKYIDEAFYLTQDTIELLKKMPSDKTVCSPEPTVNYDKYFPENWRNL